MQVRNRVRLGALAAAGSAAMLVLAAVPALASTQARRSATGLETISGTAYGAAAVADTSVVKVELRGVVAAHGTVALTESAEHTIVSSAGNLVGQTTGHKQVTRTLNAKTCWSTYTLNSTSSVLGGKSSGAFAGASGPGAVRVSLGAFEPRYTSGKNRGQCDGNASPLAKGAVESFQARFLLTVKR